MFSVKILTSGLKDSRKKIAETLAVRYVWWYMEKYFTLHCIKFVLLTLNNHYTVIEMYKTISVFVLAGQQFLFPS